MADPPLKRVLFVGNSLTGFFELATNVNRLADAAGDSLQCDVQWAAGVSLSFHLTNEVTVPKIDSGNYDLVVLQEYSWWPSVPDYRDERMFPAARTLDQHIRYQGGRTMFYQTWGYPNSPSPFCTHYDTPPGLQGCGFEPMSIAIRMAYARIASELGAAISPVGQAWLLVDRERPDLQVNLPGDYHQNASGAYLGTCVHYAALTGRSPLGNSFTDGVYDAFYLQGVADRVVFDDPWANPWGFGPNNFYWAKSWDEYTNSASATLPGIVISGAFGTASPSVKVDGTVSTTNSVYLGVLDPVSQQNGQGRLYIREGASFQANALCVGKEGQGWVRQDGGTTTIDGAITLADELSSAGSYTLNRGKLVATRICAGLGSPKFQFNGGRLSFKEFGSPDSRLDLNPRGGTLEVTDTMSIFGNYTASSGSSMVVELGGATNHLGVSGAARLGGKLVLSFAPGFEPAVGQSFEVLKAKTVISRFDSVSAPWVLRNSMHLVVLYQNDSVLIAFVDDQLDSDDNGLPDWWEIQYFGSARSGQSWTNTPLKDGIPNGIKYVLDVDPTRPGAPDQIATPKCVNQHPALTYRQQIGGSGTVGVDYMARGLIYSVEVADSVAGPWVTDTNQLVWTGDRTDNGDGTETVTVRSKSDLGESKQKFMRLVIKRATTL